VNRILPKRRRQKLDREMYDRLRREVLRRDDWRCQWCGNRSNLEVHHTDFRSHGGDDSEQNLITLCTVCHSEVHRA
jgi:5-methylcytosine-specific restriction endonuclease McrA